MYECVLYEYIYIYVYPHTYIYIYIHHRQGYSESWDTSIVVSLYQIVGYAYNVRTYTYTPLLTIDMDGNVH